MEDKVLLNRAGEFVIIPKGVTHKPIAEEEEVRLLLFEPESTVNTGEKENEFTFTLNLI